MQINLNNINLQGLRKVEDKQIACKPSIFQSHQLVYMVDSHKCHRTWSRSNWQANKLLPKHGLNANNSSWIKYSLCYSS
jgi:hypothetical protein